MRTSYGRHATFDSGSLGRDLVREQTGITLRRSQTRIILERAQAKECQRLEIPNLSPACACAPLNHRDSERQPGGVTRQPDAPT